MQAARSCRNVCWVVPDFVQCVGCSVAEHPLSRIALVTIFRNDRTKPSPCYQYYDSDRSVAPTSTDGMSAVSEGACQGNVPSPKSRACASLWQANLAEQSYDQSERALS